MLLCGCYCRGTVKQLLMIGLSEAALKRGIYLPQKDYTPRNAGILVGGGALCPR